MRTYSPATAIAVERRHWAMCWQAAASLSKRGFQTHIPTVAEAGETKLLVRRGGIEVKVEVNFVMRGTVHPVRRASLTSSARDLLLADLGIPVVSLEDLYGGKLFAAMDRQHPRDLFDVTQLFAHEGITPEGFRGNSAETQRDCRLRWLSRRPRVADTPPE